MMSRLVVSHILVVLLTSIMIGLASFLLIGITFQSFAPANYRQWALDTYLKWQFNNALEEGMLSEDILPLPGFALVIGTDRTILHAEGDTPCSAGMRLRDCAIEYLAEQAGERFVEEQNMRYVQVVLHTTSGETIIMRRETFSMGDFFAANIPITGDITSNVVTYTLITSAITALFSAPVALLLVWLTVRPLVRRISRIAKTSQEFAGGDLQVRVQDKHGDEVGQLGQHFDSMADALQQNVHMLRDLAQRNTALTQQAEQLAIQAERARLSRDLHDAIAQRLFSLTVSTSTLPALIEENQQRGVQQAQSIATLAEQTLLDLRTLLVDLRPASVSQNGLADWLHHFCQEWEQQHTISLELSVMLSGEYLSANVESALYYIVQEALSNVVRHAQASQVSVSLVEGRQQIILSITDNGIGFPIHTPAIIPGKFGIMGMRERAAALGGTLAIESDTAEGCTIRVTLPLRPVEAMYA
jgi:NarL family two-component system sensor histidine kinase LiaS